MHRLLPLAPLLAALSLALPGCRSCGGSDVDEDLVMEGEDPVVVQIGAWEDYPPPEGEDWDTRPLTPGTWATATAELACSGRALQGDPDRHRAASRGILNHHATTAETVMNFGIRLNEDSSRAQKLGAVVADAAERCD